MFFAIGDRLVHICTPNAQHFPIAKEALQAGKHVICEAAGHECRGGRRTCSLAEQQGVRNSVCHNLPLLPDGAADCGVSGDGDLGEILAFRHVFFKTGCSTIQIGTGASMPKPAFALHGRYWVALVRHGEHVTGLR